MSSPFANEEALFHEALVRPATERAAFLDQACGGSPALRARLATLLEAHAAPDGTVGLGMVPPPARPEERPGARIGRYRLLQMIGEGGCGVVYLADQLEPIHRRVALKIIKLGMDTREVIARFEGERQALALMDHPNIAHVLDAGATDAGRPYFVMELVRGIPITRFCDEHGVATVQRLELFIQVCHAVQHAHQKGIIHRDLKPSNILVTVNDGVPVPKVIDFGIAKATQGRLTDRTVFTALEQFVGTPAYMSPEQAVMRSLDVDTRSDIYSLGVLLYELLTGRTPFDGRELAQAGFDEIRRRIRETDPPKPSRRLSTMEGDVLTLTARHRQTEPPKLINLVRGDLDWIVMRCLEKDRGRRYETANGLAEDIQRHLTHRPVLASPPGTGDQLRKFLRRHQTAVAAAGAIATALVLGIVLATSQAIRATRAELAAQTEAARSKQVAQLMKEMLTSVGPRVALGRDTKLLRDILDDTAIRLDRDLRSQPEVEAELRVALGAVYLDLGDHANSVSMYQKALTRLRAPSSCDREKIADVLMMLGRALLRSGRAPEAEARLREGLAIYLDLNSDRVAQAMGQLATALAQRGMADECEALLRQRLTVARKRWGEPSEQVADAMVGLGHGLRILPGRDVAEAEGLLREAIKMFKAVGSQGLGALNGLGLLLASKGEFGEAESVFRELVPLWSKSLGREHPDLALPLGNFANALRRQGKLAEAETIFRELIELKRKFLGDDHPELASALSQLGLLLTEQGKATEAKPLMREAAAIRMRRMGVDNFGSAISFKESVLLLIDTGGSHEAEAIARESLAIRTALYPNGSWLVATSRSALGQCLLEKSKFTEAESLLLAAFTQLKDQKPSIPTISHEKSLIGTARALVTLYKETNQSARSVEWQQTVDHLQRSARAWQPPTASSQPLSQPQP